MRAHGVDISLWQDNNSTPQMFDPLRARVMGCSFVGIKTSQANYADPDYAANWHNCRGWLYRMPYHFLTWDTDPKRQAETFWSLLERDPGELPLMSDFEWWRVTPANAMDILYNFCERMRQLSAPLPLGIYTALTFWEPNGSKASYWKDFALWLCDISGEVPVPAPWQTWTFWQYTFKLDGPAYGAESLDLDGDYYNGSVEEMRARYGLGELNPIGEPVPEPLEGMRLRVLVQGLRVRSGPGTQYPILGQLAEGDLVQVRGLGGASAWVEIESGRWAAIEHAGKRYMDVA